MAELLNAFRTENGDTYEKKRDSLGRTYHVKKGEGKVSPSQFNGAQGVLSHVVTDDRGRMPRQIREADSLESLEDATGIPFTETLFRPIEDATGKEENLRAETNRWLGFRQRNTHLEPEEAAKQYLEFRNEIKDVQDPQARAIIKEQYNLGGS